MQTAKEKSPLLLEESNLMAMVSPHPVGNYELLRKWHKSFQMLKTFINHQFYA